MTRRFLGFCLMFVMAAGLSVPAHADQWTNEKTWVIDYAKSKLGFTGHLADGSEFNGQFRTFEATVDFNTEKPEKGKVSVTVDLNSVTTGDKQRDSMLPQPEWFDIVKWPQAKFESESIKVAGKDVNLNQVYDITGYVIIKNIKKKVTIPFTLKQEGEVWHAQGALKLRRSDFNIGEGEFANETQVKAVVAVTIDIMAKPNS